MAYKLIGIDMDGSLLSSSNEVTSRTRLALDQAKAKGVLPVIATGRILESASYYRDKLKLNTPIIACNGAMIVDGEGRELFKSSLSKTNVKTLLEAGQRYGVYFHAYDRKAFYGMERREDILKLYDEGTESFKVEFKQIDEDGFLEGNLELFKFLYIDNNPKKLKELRTYLEEVEGLNISSSWTNNIEVMNKGVSKGDGLEILCQELEISLEDCMAIGDSENDISMFKLAGMPVAMDNSSDYVKSFAKWISESNDRDGVALAIEKFIL